MELKLLLKRGGLLAAANWPVVAIQFAAQTTFQALLAVPIIGAAILVAVLLGGDLANLLQGSLRDIFTTIANALMAEPVALIAFIAAFGIVLRYLFALAAEQVEPAGARRPELGIESVEPGTTVEDLLAQT